MELVQVKKEEREFVSSCGGYWEVTEFDTDQNRITRDKIKCFPIGSYLGNVNFYDEERKNILTNPILIKYEGQKVCNFEFAFIIPCYDEILVNLIREYNLMPFDNKKITAKIDEIFDRIESLSGEYLHWV